MFVMPISPKKIIDEFIHRGPKETLLGIVLLYQCSYLVFDFISHNYFHYIGPFEKLGFSTWEPMAGISIALLYIYEIPFIPFVFLCPIISELIFKNEKLGTFLLFGGEVISSTCYILAFYILKNLVEFDPRLRRVKDVVSFTMVGAFISFLNTVFTIVPIYLTSSLQTNFLFSASWRLFVGEVSGILSAGPLLFFIIYFKTPIKINFTYSIQIIVLSFILMIIFWYPNASVFQLFYLLFLPSVWIALSSNSITSASSLLFVQIVSLFGSEARFGPDMGRGAVQSMIIALAFTILVVAAIVSEKEDATKRLREQEAALNRAIRVKTTGETASLIAHEINQPLTALTTYVEVAQKSLFDKDNILERIKKEAERASSIIRSIRTLIRKDSVLFCTIYTEDIFTDIYDILQNEALRSNSLLEIKNDIHETTIFGDLFQIQQCIINLVTNSAEAISSTKRNGKIKIQIFKTSSSQCAIEVEDNGPGFPPYYDLNKRLPFMSSKDTGTGMGLSIVQSIAEIHGGILEIESNNFRTIARIKLPLSL